MLILALDDETHPFDEACITPPPICLSYCQIVPSAIGGWQKGPSDVLPFFRGKGVALDAVECWLEQGAFLIGANVAYDVLTTIVGAYQRSKAFGDKLFALFVKAYDEDRIADVFIRQKLLDLSFGSYRHEGNYNLKDLSRRFLGKERAKGDESWQKRFNELEFLEPKAYPFEAREYSLEDSLDTADIWICQNSSAHGGLRDARLARNFPGKNPLVDEFRQTRAALALYATSAYGLRTDPEGVKAFEIATHEAYEEVKAELIEAGLIRREYARDAELAEKYINAKGFGKYFGQTPSGGLSLKGKDLLATGDPNLKQLANWKFLSEFDKAALVDAGLARCDESRDKKEASRRIFLAYARPEELGLEGEPREVPRTKGWAPYKIGKDGRPRGNPAHTPDSMECVALDKDACVVSEDPIMEKYAEFVSLDKTLSTDIKALHQGVAWPIHARFENILETGRVSASKPNTMNPPRKPGARECYTARNDTCLIDCDFPSLELSTLAQACYWSFGYSIIGDTLAKGRDIHLETATEILHRSYDDLFANKKKPEVSKARTLAKPGIFGVPGGLGKKKLAEFSYKGYGLRLSLKESDDLIKTIKRKYPEIADHFRWVEAHRSPNAKKFVDIDGREKLESKFNIEQPWAGRLRADATYCAAANTIFQGLGSDVAKYAMWLIWKACYGFSELGTNDPLYLAHGRIVHFVHDQFLVEVSTADMVMASRAAWRVAELMNRAGKEVMPDTNMQVEPVLSNCWSKKSATFYVRSDGTPTWNIKEAALHENGKPQLALWDLDEQCKEFGKKAQSKLGELYLNKDNEAVFELKDAVMGADGKPVLAASVLGPDGAVISALKKDEWPGYVIDRVALQLGLAA